VTVGDSSSKTRPAATARPTLTVDSSQGVSKSSSTNEPPRSFGVNALGVLVPDSFASASIYAKLSPDSQLLSDCDSPAVSPTALLALPVAGRAVYAIPSLSPLTESSSIEVEQLDVLVGDDVEDDDDLAERALNDEDIGDANSDIYIDDDDDENNADVTTADDDNANDDDGFSLARLAADHVRLPPPQHGGDDNDDESSEGPSRVFKAPKSALIALLNSVSAVAPSASYDGRVADLRESDIAYLEHFQEQSAVVSKILLSSAKLPPVKSKVRLPSPAQQLRQPYSVQAPPISIDSRIAPSQYQEIPPLAQLKKQPPLPAKLSRREYTDLSGDAAATSKLFVGKTADSRSLSAPTPVAPQKWRSSWPTTIVVLCLKCCEPTAVRPRPRVLSRALSPQAKSIPCGSCNTPIIPPLLPPPTCDECRLRRPATRVRTSGSGGANDTVVWLCRRCCARVERLLATVVEDLPTLADNSIDQFASTGAQHAIFQAEMVTEILLKRAIEPPGFHRITAQQVLARSSVSHASRKAVPVALTRASSIL
jgi:hypothetical protein